LGFLEIILKDRTLKGKRQPFDKPNRTKKDIYQAANEFISKKKK
tara:strand:+ start:408 stop:539 length:132 start_codon:yes stop_codon:yes gene_type:complete